jgi:hypothetical protein
MSSAPDGPMQRSARAPILPGCKVFTLDGQSLGEVSDVREDRFKLNAQLKRDYWLSCDEVWSADIGGVHVNFNSADLELHKVPGPVDPAPGA